jgi:hypothetical protein
LFVECPPRRNCPLDTFVFRISNTEVKISRAEDTWTADENIRWMFSRPARGYKNMLRRAAVSGKVSRCQVSKAKRPSFLRWSLCFFLLRKKKKKQALGSVPPVRLHHVVGLCGRVAWPKMISHTFDGISIFCRFPPRRNCPLDTFVFVNLCYGEILEYLMFYDTISWYRICIISNGG